MIGQTLPAVLIVLVLALWPLALPPERRGRIWRREGLIWFAGVGGLVALFIIGEAFTDPGGVEAAAMVAAWVVPAAALSWLAFARPNEGVITLASVCALTTAFSVWAIAVDGWWWKFENEHGPISSIATFAATVPLGVLAIRKTWIAGWLLVASSVIPEIAAFAREPQRGAASLGFLTTPAMVAGVLFVLAGAAQRRSERLAGGLVQPPGTYPNLPGGAGPAA